MPNRVCPTHSPAAARTGGAGMCERALAFSDVDDLPGEIDATRPGRHMAGIDPHKT